MPKKIKFEWSRREHFGARIEFRERCLHIDVAGEGADWFSLAVETAARVETAGDVFDDHAHHVIGRSRSRVAAMKKAETYARKWLRAHERANMPRPAAAITRAGLSDDLPEPCGCDDISLN